MSILGKENTDDSLQREKAAQSAFLLLEGHFIQDQIKMVWKSLSSLCDGWKTGVFHIEAWMLLDILSASIFLFMVWIVWLL